jgi:hypothetical protein
MSTLHQWLILLFGVVTALSASMLLASLFGRLLRPRAPAYCIGVQTGINGEAFRVYNLTRDIPGHPAGSTVSEIALRLKGYRLP